MFLRIIALLVFISFALHFAWESLHVGLYTGYEDLSPVLPIHVWATVGDVLYTLVAFALASAFKRGIEWVREATSADYLALAALGFFIALYVEYKALALGRWVYTADMPLIPGFEVGLSPILQMMILVPLTVFIVSLVERSINR